MNKLVSMLAVAPLIAGATEYYADPAKGNDANDGRSAATAFRTLERATRGLKAGDALNLSAGAVFAESLVLRASGIRRGPSRMPAK